MNSLLTMQESKMKNKMMKPKEKGSSKSQSSHCEPSGNCPAEEKLVREKRTLIPCYTMLSKYYKGELLGVDSGFWQDLWSALRRENTGFADAFTLLNRAEACDFEQLPYDFNRLFIGPGRLLAPPYESCYRNEGGLLMQKETLAVREAYREADLQLVFSNKEPDDFLGYELEFLEILLSRADQDKKAFELYRRFWRQHLAVWIDRHCADVLLNTHNKICRGMALILQSLQSLACQEAGYSAL